jgi:ketosteroid isomerase-like protein
MAMYQGTCHCERVRFEVTGDLGTVTECNCSMCRRKAYVHWIVPRDAFRLLAGEDAITTYRFNTGVAQHHFCRHCGVAGFYVPRSHPDCIDVNVRCLPDVDLDALPRRHFDGRNWEAQVAEFRRAASAGAAPEHANAARVRALFAAFRSGDVATVQATIPEDAVWHFPGREGQLAGSHRGREAILRFLMSVPALTDGTFHLDIQDVVANDRNAVALFRGHGTRAGRTLDNPTALVMKIANGQVREVHEFVWDLFHVDAFWS